MNGKETGRLLARLRRERGMTQRQVAEAIHVSAQAVSKWERGQGCPDVDLLPLLAGIFGVGVERLLEGDLTPEDSDSGNMRRLKFYMCASCGNILTATGGGELYCCGRKLKPLAARPVDAAHAVTARAVEEDWYITFCHPMEKGHFLRFAACAAPDRFVLVRLYPEQGGEFRIPQLSSGGKLYLCCSRDGLFETDL